MAIDAKDLSGLVLKRLAAYSDRANSDELLGEFVGVEGHRTLGRWLKGEMAPVGEKQIKLWIFLRAVGFDSPEFDEMPAFNRYITELFAYGILGQEDVMKACGIANPQGAYLTMRGSPPMHPTDTLEDMQMVYGDELAAAKALLDEQLRAMSQSATRPSVPKPTTADPPRQSAPKPPPEKVPVPVADESAVSQMADTKSAAHAVSHSRPSVPGALVVAGGMSPALTAAMHAGALLPLVHYLASDEATLKERNLFRELLGQSTLFELQNSIVALQSERARNNRK